MKPQSKGRSWVCPIHPNQALVAMWETDPMVEHRAAWRCDLCRCLYAINDAGYWVEVDWPEIDRKEYYQGRREFPDRPRSKSIIVPGRVTTVPKPLIVPGR